MGELWDEIVKRGKNAQDAIDFIDLYVPQEEPSFIHDMLVLRRNYIINKVKAPLQKGLVNLGRVGFFQKIICLIEIIKAIKRFPRVNRNNARKANTFVLLDIAETFFEYENNPGRKPLFDAVIKIGSGENEHDNYYGSRLCFWLEMLIIAVLLGKWHPRPEHYPDPRQWREPQPYGGENTIIAAIQKNKEQIIDLLGEKWAWLKGGQSESNSSDKD